MAKTFLSGGHKLSAFIKQTRANLAQVKLPIVTIGFHDPTISAIAVVHEFGAGKVPERPAFRIGVTVAERAWKAGLEHCVVVDKHRGVYVDHARLKALAIEVRDVIRGAYDNVQGPALGERQTARKEGTPGEGKLLIGHRGPKLREHINVFLDGVEVG